MMQNIKMSISNQTNNFGFFGSSLGLDRTGSKKNRIRERVNPENGCLFGTALALVVE
jgi:hypothetical protein